MLSNAEFRKSWHLKLFSILSKLSVQLFFIQSLNTSICQTLSSTLRETTVTVTHMLKIITVLVDK